MVILEKSLVLYDWLTFSVPGPVDRAGILAYLELLGLASVPFSVMTSGSRLRYRYRWACGGMSVHWTDETEEDINTGYNEGCCFEFSGQGCREFETYSRLGWPDLFELIQTAGWRVTRLDIAFDDKHNHFPILDIDKMAHQAINREFTSRLRKFRVLYDCDLGSHDTGLSVCHGSKSSEVFIRCYDKRVERGVFDQIKHWVRLELQLRGSACSGWLSAVKESGCSVGLTAGYLFRAVVGKYLQYRESTQDSNKARWPLSGWWVRFLQDVEYYSITERLTVDYNKGQLDRFVYGTCYNSIATEIMIDGLPKVLHRIFDSVACDLPEKYRKLIADCTRQNSEAVAELVERSELDVMLESFAALGQLLDSLGCNSD